MGNKSPIKHCLVISSQNWIKFLFGKLKHLSRHTLALGRREGEWILSWLFFLVAKSKALYEYFFFFTMSLSRLQSFSDRDFLIKYTVKLPNLEHLWLRLCGHYMTWCLINNHWYLATSWIFYSIFKHSQFIGIN